MGIENRVVYAPMLTRVEAAMQHGSNRTSTTQRANLSKSTRIWRKGDWHSSSINASLWMCATCIPFAGDVVSVATRCVCACAATIPTDRQVSAHLLSARAMMNEPIFVFRRLFPFIVKMKLSLFTFSFRFSVDSLTDCRWTRQVPSSSFSRISFLFS